MKFFGYHPDFKKHYRSCIRKGRKTRKWDLLFGDKILLKDFFNPLHPEVYLVPRDRFISLKEDEWEHVFPGTILRFPFSSYDFWIDQDFSGGVFKAIHQVNAFWRLGEISQLGYLVPPSDRHLGKQEKIYYSTPQFIHTRFLHSSLTAALADVVLARNGFSREERAPFILAAAFHDIATPAGGDSIKRIDSFGLDEEENFHLILKCDGLDKKLKSQFGFDLEKAQGWVKGEAKEGHLLDILDKTSYTAVDCCAVGAYPVRNIRKQARSFPLVMDVWQDIRVEKERVYFTDPGRLYNFLLLRAYAHSEFYLNSRCRALDHTLCREARDLYKAGQVNRKELLLHGDKWLEKRLEESNGLRSCFVTPDDWISRKFLSQEAMEKFCRKMGKKIDHTEHIKPFKTGLNWLVSSGGTVMSLQEAIAEGEVKKLENISQSLAGWYAYYRK